MNTDPLNRLSKTVDDFLKRDSIAKACSVHAYEIVKPKTEKKHKDQVIEALKEINRPACCEEISKFCALDKYQVRRAVSKLKKENVKRIEEYTQTKIGDFRYTMYRLPKVQPNQ